MKTNSTATTASLSSRLLIGFTLCLAGFLLALAGLRMSVTGTTTVTNRANSAPLITKDLISDGVVEDGEAGLTYFGYCEASDSTGRWRTNGQCVSHNIVGFCYIKSSTDCPNGRKVYELSSVSCGGLGSAEVDLARSCSFQID